MKNRTIFLSVVLSVCLLSGIASAQFTQVWKVSAGTWPMLSAGDATRGAALNRSNGHYLVTRRDIPRIYVFDASNGNLLDSLNMTGISGGGGSVLQDIEITSDGVVYATNLVGTPISASDTTFKIYRWANDNNATVPTIAFSGRPIDRNGRFGDAVDVAGIGTGTVIYVGGNNAGTDSVLVFTTGDGSAFTNSGTIRITGNDAGAGISQISPGGDFLTSRLSGGQPVRSYSSTGTGRLEAVPSTVTPAFQADIAYLEAAGRKWIASAESASTAGAGKKGVLLNATYGLAGAVKVGATPNLGTNANTTSLGADVEMQYNAADSSMTLFVMADNNGIAAYKSGNLLLANLPPFGGNIVRSQFVPLTGQNDTVFVDVQDDQFVPADSVKLYYSLNGGANTVVSMTRISGDSIKGKYRGIIPAASNTNGARIAYYVTVADNQGVRFTSTTSGYFAGMTKLSYFGGPREVDSNGVILYKGYGIRSQGVVIAEDSIFQVANSEIVVQDSLGGVTVFRFGTPGPLFDVKRGNAYIITGTTDNPSGGGSKFQFVDPGITFTDLGPAPPIKPRVITIKQLLANAEQWENTLVEIRGVSKTVSSPAWPTAGTSANMTFIDASGDSTTMRIDSDTNIDGIPEPSYPITIIGVQGQFDNTSPFTSGYQWLPRDTNDIRPFKLRPPVPPFVLNNANITFGASLDTVQAGSGGRKGIGTGALVLSEDRNELMYQVTVSGLSGTITQAHFHSGAPGVGGGVVKNITFNGQTAYGFWRASDATQPLTPALLADLLTGRLYFNVHTSTFGGGEIRGQIYPGSGVAFAAVLDSTQAKTSSTANGTAAVFLTSDRSTVKYSVTIDGLEGNLTSSHFHNAPADTNGGVVKDITFVNGTAVGEWKKTDGTQPLTDQLIAELMRGRLYFNVHSSQSPGGEIRGQVRLVGGYGLAAMLDSAQAGTNKPGRGTALFHFKGQDVNALNYRITVSGISGDITGAHIHIGAKGVAGPVVKPLNFFGNTAYGSWSETDSTNKLTDSLFAALIRGRLYVNIHTAAHPGGEIRGQIELTTGFGIAVGLDNAQAGKTGNGKGTGWVTLSPNQDELTYNVTVNDLTGGITNSHFHSARRGISGGVVKNMTFTNGNSTGSWKASDGTQPLTNAMVDSLFSEALYVNIHTALNSGGEIRGQLSPGKGSLSTVKRISDIVPTEFALEQNYPNPFNPTTMIQFALPNDATVSLKIYDVLGREVRTLINSDVAAGTNSIEWNGKNNAGTQVSSGMYIYRIEARKQGGGQAGSFISTKKMMLLK